MSSPNAEPKPPYCCDTFAGQVEYVCDEHNPDVCPDQVVIKSKTHGFLLQAPNAHYSIRFCPWCGTRVLPDKD